MIALFTGGSGCGKSTFAEKLVNFISNGKRYYIATMMVYDDESVERVKRHCAQRAGQDYETLEYPKALDASRIELGSTVLLEDLPNLAANEMFDGGDVSRILPAVRALETKCAHLIIVTNDVFSDGVTYGESTDAYIRELAQINRAVAADADVVCELVYSIPVVLKGALPCGL